jgi:transketolase
MRAEFAKAMIALGGRRTDLVFLTTDLGYMAVEGIAAAFGDRFINAGVAEQNAISLAAGLASEGQLPWVYSMSAFAVLRPYAQLRDNVCLPALPVKLVGNGGGYGYGIMGTTHHALEDVGAMRALPNVRLYLPLTATDVPQVVAAMAEDPLPNYLRLNAAARIPGGVPPFSPWRRLQAGRGCVVVAMGPIVESLYEMGAPDLLAELEIWSVGTLPLEFLPAELTASIRDCGRLVTLEEHYRACGLGEALSHLLLTSGVLPRSLTSLHAAGYPSGRYGSQRWHQEESGLRGPALAARLEKVLRG